MSKNKNDKDKSSKKNSNGKSNQEDLLPGRKPSKALLDAIEAVEQVGKDTKKKH